MSPWKVLGWLLVALLCLLLTAGAYGLALLWGWSLPSVWWLAAIAGAGAGVALIIFLFRTPARGAAFGAPPPLAPARRRGIVSALARHFGKRGPPASFRWRGGKRGICRIMEHGARPLDRR